MDELVSKMKQTRRVPVRLAERPDDPEPVVYLWDTWRDIRLGIDSNGFGIGAITWADLTSWQRESGIVLSSFEKNVILRLDGSYREVMQEKPGAPWDGDEAADDL